MRQMCSQYWETSLIYRLITFQSPHALLSVWCQPPEGSLVIPVCAEGSHPWKWDIQVTLPVPAGPNRDEKAGGIWIRPEWRRKEKRCEERDHKHAVTITEIKHVKKSNHLLHYLNYCAISCAHFKFLHLNTKIPPKLWQTNSKQMRWKWKNL